MKTVFLSHNWNDKVLAKRIGKYLSTYGVKCWIDEAEIKVGESLIEKIGNAIIGCDFFAVILSKNSVKSEWVRKELQLALQKEIKLKNTVVLPIRIDSNIDIPPFLWDKKYIDFSKTENFEDNIMQLIDVIGVSDKDILDIRNQSYLWHQINHKIKIEEISGKKAIWTKESIVTPIRDNIYLWFDVEIHGSGEIKIMGTNIGEITKFYNEGGVYTIITEFNEPLPQKRISKKINFQLANCFLEDKENITWIPIGDFDSMNFEIVLPQARPFKNEPKVYGYFGTNRKLIKNLNINLEYNKCNIKIIEPQSGIKYLVEWEW